MQTGIDSRITTQFTTDSLTLDQLKIYILRCERDGMLPSSRIQVHMTSNGSQPVGMQVIGQVTFIATKPYHGEPI